MDSASVKVPILRANEVTDRWPVLLWFYLKTLGLYHSGNESTEYCVNHFVGSHPVITDVHILCILDTFLRPCDMSLCLSITCRI